MDGQLYNSKHSFVKKNHFLISLEKDFDRCIKNKNAPSEKIFNSWCIAPSHTKFSWASQGCGLTFSNLLCVHRANTPTLVYQPDPQLQRLIKVILVKSCGEIFLHVFLSKSFHYHFVQLSEQPISWIPNILFVYFLSIFSRQKFWTNIKIHPKMPI